MKIGNHIIDDLTLDGWDEASRKISVCIDGVRVYGRLRYYISNLFNYGVPLQAQYRLMMDDKSIKKHPDYEVFRKGILHLYMEMNPEICKLAREAIDR